jgi:hypothetical protein
MKKYITMVLLPILLIGCVRKSELEKSQSDLAAAQEKIKSLEQEISQLKPLADKARQLPITTSLDRHAANAGYNLLIQNQAKTPLRLAITVTANGRSKNLSPVVDGDHRFTVTGLAPGDTVSIVSDGYDPMNLTIK